MTDENRDCQCMVHEGPHWLYEDFLDRERNLEYLDRFASAIETRNADEFVMAWEAWRQSEQARLREKLHNMRQEDRKRDAPGTYRYTILGIASRVETMEQRSRDLWARLENARKGGCK